MTFVQIIHHTDSHVVGKDCFRIYSKTIPSQGRKNEQRKLTHDAMYTKKRATENAVPAKIRDPEKINTEQLRKVLAPLKPKQDKAIPRTKIIY